MTSRISFFKLLHHEWKAASGVFGLCCLFFAAVIPLRIGAIIQLYGDWKGTAAELRYRILREILPSVFGVAHYINLIFFTIAAVAGAVFAFGYLTSRKKVDFYHSLAMHRGSLFGIRYLCGCMMILAPAVLNAMLGLLMLAAAGRLYGMKGVLIILLMMLWSMIYILAVYSIVILGLVLSGRIVVGLCIAFVFSFYLPICRWTFEHMMGNLHPTFVAAQEGSLFDYLLSPIGAPLIKLQYYGDALLRKEVLLMCIAGVIFTGIVFLISFILFCRRPSEVAESAYAFPKAAPVIKIVISVPAGMFASTLLADTVAKSMSVWIVAGSLIIGTICGMTIDAIVDQDILAGFRHWKSGAALVLCSAAILSFYFADPFRYDEWLPKKNQIQAMGIFSAEGMEPIGNFPVYGAGMYAKHAAENGLIENFDPIYSIAAEGIRHTDLSDDELTDKERSVYTSALIVYKMRGGRSVSRFYHVPINVVRQSFAQLSMNGNIRRQFYPTASLNTDEIGEMEYKPWVLGGDMKKVNGKIQDKNIVEALRTDVENTTLNEAQSQLPLGAITLYKTDDDLYASSQTPYSQDFYIYPSYHKTIEALKTAGFQIPDHAGGINNIQDILSVTIEWNKKYYRLNDTEEIQKFISAIQFKVILKEERDNAPYVSILYANGDGDGGNCVISNMELFHTLIQNKKGESAS